MEKKWKNTIEIRMFLSETVKKKCMNVVGKMHQKQNPALSLFNRFKSIISVFPYVKLKMNHQNKTTATMTIFLAKFHCSISLRIHLNGTHTHNTSAVTAATAAAVITPSPTMICFCCDYGYSVTVFVLLLEMSVEKSARRARESIAFIAPCNRNTVHTHTTPRHTTPHNSIQLNCCSFCSSAYHNAVMFVLVREIKPRTNLILRIKRLIQWRHATLTLQTSTKKYHHLTNSKINFQTAPIVFLFSFD